MWGSRRILSMLVVRVGFVRRTFHAHAACDAASQCDAEAVALDGNWATGRHCPEFGDRLSRAQAHVGETSLQLSSAHDVLEDRFLTLPEHGERVALNGRVIPA